MEKGVQLLGVIDIVETPGGKKFLWQQKDSEVPFPEAQVPCCHKCSTLQGYVLKPLPWDTLQRELSCF